MTSPSSWHPIRLPTSLEPAHEERRLEPVPHPSGVWIDWGPPLPEEYRQDRIALLVRDPWCVFAYWELTGAHADRVPQRHGPTAFATGKWFVRLRRDGRLVLEEPASHPLGTRYFPAEADRRYQAEIGLKLPKGEWVQVAISAEVRTPRAWIAAVVDDDWAVSEEEMLRQLGFSAEEAERRAALVRAGQQAGYPPPGAGAGSSFRR